MSPAGPWLLVLVPIAGALLASAWRGEASRPWLLPAVGAAHAALAWAMFAAPPPASPDAWLAFDPLARAVLPGVSTLFLACAWYGVGYLADRRARPNRAFVAALLLVLGLVSAGLEARHLGVLWITTEALTLAAVPLVHANATPRAFEATWKYLLVGGTGVAISLFGSFCLGYASLHAGGSGDLTFVALTAQGAGLSRPWVLVAWVMLLVGYGTKMGLAPFHTWKPDAYGEAPGVVGAVLAGAVTTVAFCALLRVRAVVAAAGAGAAADRTLLVVGLTSMALAALFLLGTRDFKRMLAYSSVEHMGVLAVGAALGPAGAAAALFHVWSNGLTKGALFLSAGNLRRYAGSASMDHVRGLLSCVPRSASVFLVGVLAVTACPPFGVFFSELAVLRAALAGGHVAATSVFVACLLCAFLGLTRVTFGVLDGRPRGGGGVPGARQVEAGRVVLPPLALLVVSLVLGLATPQALRDAWADAVRQLFPTP